MVHGGWFFGYCGSKVRGHSSHWMGDLVLTTAHSNKNSISYIYECVQNRSTDIISSDPNASCPCGIKEKRVVANQAFFYKTPKILDLIGIWASSSSIDLSLYLHKIYLKSSATLKYQKKVRKQTLFFWILKESLRLIKFGRYILVWESFSINEPRPLIHDYPLLLKFKHIYIHALQWPPSLCVCTP